MKTDFYRVGPEDDDEDCPGCPENGDYDGDLNWGEIEEVEDLLDGF